MPNKKGNLTVGYLLEICYKYKKPEKLKMKG